MTKQIADIPVDKRLWCPKKKSGLPWYAYVPKIVYCQHCKEKHISPRCTNYRCMHMLKDPKTRQYLKRYWPQVVEVWEMNVIEQLEKAET